MHSSTEEKVNGSTVLLDTYKKCFMSVKGISDMKPITAKYTAIILRDAEALSSFPLLRLPVL